MLKFKRVAGGDDGREGLTLDLFIFGVCVRTSCGGQKTALSPFLHYPCLLLNVELLSFLRLVATKPQLPYCPFSSV